MFTSSSNKDLITVSSEQFRHCSDRSPHVHRTPERAVQPTSSVCVHLCLLSNVFVVFVVCIAVRGEKLVLLVSAAQAMPLTHGDVGLVHRLNVGLRRHDNAVTEVSSTHPPPAENNGRREKSNIKK